MKIISTKKEIHDFLRTGNLEFLGERVAQWEADAKEMRTIGRRLAHIRAFMGVSQTEMASRLGIALRTWQYYEQDQRLPDAEVLMVFVRWGLNLDWVLMGAGPAVSDGRDHLSAPFAPNGEMLMTSHELTEEAIRGTWLPKNRFFDLVSLVYMRLAQSIPYAEIIDFARSEASRLAGQQTNEIDKQKAGEVDSEQTN